MTESVDVAVVGSGPNGLAAAVIAARAGLGVRVYEAQSTVGGGARTLDLGLSPGVVHDVCSAVHPMGIASPFFREFDLPARGVRFLVPEVSYAQPLFGLPAGLVYRDLDRTVAELGSDGPAWQDLMAPLVAGVDDVLDVVLGDKRSLPRGVLTPAAARFVAGVVEQGSVLWNRRFTGNTAPALLSGAAMHAIGPMPSLATGASAMLLGMLAHSHGWPIPAGGTQTITDALVADLVAHGGRVCTDRPIADLGELPRARAYLFDTSADGLLRILGDRVPMRFRRAVGRFRHGDAAAKVDFVLSADVPWSDPRVGVAGTVHLGGTRAEMAAAERAVAAGQIGPRPNVLVSAPSVVDRSRIAPNGHRPLWSYAHVPNGSAVDVTELVTARIERYAPGFRDLVVATRCVPASRLAECNANYVGGDIAAGAVTFYRTLARPTARRDPYRVPVDGVYLCSQATPPGPGVHGMAGYWCAKRVLRQRFGITELPSSAPD
ncbi:phytoene desaturase family protein [Skermania piniformis]|uniref:NAD(P)/FAD-dependent oxidoreductase n=1 Tax=Skermania pinensis TaxID=39122 RepID=A0ABX8SBI9_9ACTN|nr:NAD(P)/FAD-dependent oxidoreductase [Skermania piniformis]QXQ15235.1 NAD(P)/FAD-dependent oxidoreductase [Skermania piniformis]